MKEKQGFIPLQQLQRMVRQQNGGVDPQLKPRPNLTCPPKPDNFDNSSFFGDSANPQTSTQNKNVSNISDVANNVTNNVVLNKMPQSHVFSKYQIKEDTCFYIRFGIIWDQQRLIVTYQDKLNPQIQSHWLKFRMWSFQQCNKIKNDCCQLDRYRNYIYNKVKLFRQQLKHLLIDWSFGIDNPNMRLMHVNKILSDESINLIMNMHPNILFFIQEKLKDILQGNK